MRRLIPMKMSHRQFRCHPWPAATLEPFCDRATKCTLAASYALIRRAGDTLGRKNAAIQLQNYSAAV